MSTELREKLEEILKSSDLPDRHTFFQIEKFIIGKEPTGHSQLWQIIRELQARKETIDSYEKDLKDAEDNIELFDIKIEKLDREIKLLSKIEINDENCVDLEIKEKEINIRKIQREKEFLIKSARRVSKKMKSTLEEIAFLISGYDKILSHIGEFKNIDDESCQKEYWNEKLLEEFNLRALLGRSLDPEFVKTIMAIHDDAPVKKHMSGLLIDAQKRMIENNKPKE